jgi:hypothetical protein
MDPERMREGTQKMRTEETRGLKALPSAMEAGVKRRSQRRIGFQFLRDLRAIYRNPFAFKICTFCILNGKKVSRRAGKDLEGS